MNTKEIKAMLMRHRAMQAERSLLTAAGEVEHTRLASLSKQIAIVNAWLRMLKAEERFVVTRHLVDGLVWPLVLADHKTRWDGALIRDERTLKRYQAQALRKISRWAREHPVSGEQQVVKQGVFPENVQNATPVPLPETGKKPYTYGMAIRQIYNLEGVLSMEKTIKVYPEDSIFLAQFDEVKRLTEVDAQEMRVMPMASAAYAMPDPNYLTYAVIRQGSSGRDVKFAQQMLHVFMRGYGYTLDVDGQFGPGTAKVAQAFQAKCGLGQDAVIGAQTWLRLGPAVSHGMSYWNHTLAKKEVQQLLKIGRRYSGAIDGDYGAGTVNAVKDFQRSYNLSVDGIWGKQCWGIIEQGWI